MAFPSQGLLVRFIIIEISKLNGMKLGHKLSVEMDEIFMPANISLGHSQSDNFFHMNNSYRLAVAAFPQQQYFLPREFNSESSTVRNFSSSSSDAEVI